LAAVELAIRTAMTRLGGSLLEQLLAVDTGHRGPRVDCGAGHQGGFVSYRTKTVDTVLGPISLDRAYYHCAPCGHGVLPKDDELGLTGVSLSTGLRAMVARTGAAAPCAKASTLLTELYIAVDGTGVPMVPAETNGRAGKAPDGRAHTREVKLGVLFTQTSVDEKGRPVRDPGSSSYLATMEPVEHFGSLVYAEARRRGSSHAQQLVVLGDGAPWIWNLASKHFPTATQIVDLYHAREHLHALGALVAPTLGEHAHGWLTDRLADLDRGDVPTLLAAARALTLPEAATEAVDKALGYFQTNAARMRYAHFRQHGHFVGSGAIEAGCKAVVGQRLKLSGMRWNTHGATGIVTLRCQEASGRWNEIWQRLDTQTSAA
jgi:hypothetical protein